VGGVLGKDKHPIKASRRPIKEFGFAGHDGKGGQKIVVPVDPREPQRLELEWDQPKEAPGNVHVFDVVQRGRRGRRALGGARIVVVTR
jgi:hypothetical protein